MDDIPSDLASLVKRPFVIGDDDANVLQYNARRGGNTNGLHLPTPRGGPFEEYDAQPEEENKRGYDGFHSRDISIDFFRLVFQPSQVEQFRNDLKSDFEPIRSASALAFNIWRRDIIIDEGCERLLWGIYDESASDTIILFICNSLLPKTSSSDD